MAGLKLCGKRLNKHCDNNGDSKVSQTEWRACLDMQSTYKFTIQFLKNLIIYMVSNISIFIMRTEVGTRVIKKNKPFKI